MRNKQPLKIFRLSPLLLAFPFFMFASSAHAVSKVDFWKEIAWDKIIAGEKETLVRYGNWFGPGWWGGSEKESQPGGLAPVDDLDRVAQKHDFGYMLAEQLGKHDRNVEHFYKHMADMIAVSDVRKLDEDPQKWQHPPKNIDLAKRYRQRIEVGFPTYQEHNNYLKSLIPLASDKADLSVINAQLDRAPGQKQEYLSRAEFEKLLVIEVKKWNARHQKKQNARTANAGDALDRASKSIEASQAMSKYGMLCTCEDWNADGKFGIVLGKEIVRANYGTYAQCMALARELPRCQPEGKPAASPKGDKCNWTGTWDTTFKTLTLHQHGNSVTGTYAHQGGRVEGMAEDCSLSGTWFEDGNQYGCFRFSLAETGESFTGSWGYKEDCSRDSWSGTRK